MADTPVSAGVPPDAGMSLLGVYGLRNPTMVWLLNRRPDLLAETPKEWGWQPGAAPICETYSLTDHMFCGRLMVFRYVDGRPAWVCYAHDSTDDETRSYYYRFIERPTPKLQTLPDFDLFAAIGAALEGRSLDMRWNDQDGEWSVIDR